MNFSNPTFLFLFLPIVLLFNSFIKATRWSNLFLLLASLFFYAWGETLYLFVLLLSVVFNYIGGLCLHSTKDKTAKKITLGLFISLNLLALIYFKYLSFLGQMIGLNITKDIYLPLGISFFTFQAISYLIDLYYQKVEVQRNPIDLGLYITLFPQLIAGPIVRYIEINAQLANRKVELDGMVAGLQRFIIGLSKKVIIANNLAFIADYIFGLPADTLPMSMAWLGALAFSLQIYFDFSGYSDMAIGIGLMLGFTIPENFNYPYISKSIKDFWRRWHLTLSRWFRDYLYIPLGGNQKGSGRTYFNLCIVFLLCGLWHGANYTFIIWGLLHGFFLVLERKFNFIEKLPSIVGRIYVFFVIIFSWVIFRSEHLDYCLAFCKSMLGLSNGQDYSPLYYLSNFHIFIFILAIVFSLPIFNYFKPMLEAKNGNSFKIIYALSCVALFIVCIMEISMNTFQPFIYFRF